MSEPEIILGRDLRVGDVVEMWGEPKRNQITDLFPYTGPLAYLWGGHGGARIAAFLLGNRSMTIEPIARFKVFQRGPTNG